MLLIVGRAYLPGIYVMDRICHNVANVGLVAVLSLGEQFRGAVALALRCRCLRARSGPADG